MKSIRMIHHELDLVQTICHFRQYQRMQPNRHEKHGHNNWEGEQTQLLLRVLVHVANRVALFDQTDGWYQNEGENHIGPEPEKHGVEAVLGPIDVLYGFLP